MSSLGGGTGPMSPMGGGPRSGRGPPLAPAAMPPLPRKCDGGIRGGGPNGGSTLYPVATPAEETSGRILTIPGGPPAEPLT